MIEFGELLERKKVHIAHYEFPAYSKAMPLGRLKFPLSYALQCRGAFCQRSKYIVDYNNVFICD